MTQRSTAMDWLIGGGEMGKAIRAMDWSKTPLGSIESWPQSLRTTVSILLSTGHPMVLFWGPELVQFYNDGYRPSLGAHKHPQALGQRGAECWTEIWHIIGPQIQNVMTKGQETWHEDQLVPFDRNGYFEEIYFTYSYSPVRDETGGVGGTLVVCTETTQQVLSKRRLQTLRELSANAMKTITVKTACQEVTNALCINPYDIPFALLYLVENGQQASLVGNVGMDAGLEASPMQVSLTQTVVDQDVWGLAQVYHTGQALLVNDLATRFKALPGGVWNTAPASAIVMPITQPGQDNLLAGLLVIAISPRREFDDQYRGFFDLVAKSVATAIADARAYEAERQRAETLAEIDRAKTVFFSNVSHEFRTPLTLMLAPAEDALADTETPLPPIQRNRVEVIHRNSLRLLKLVNTLLDFSRIEAGRIQACYEPTDLAQSTTELASTFRSLIERAGLSFVVECAPLSEPIYIDQDMWEKIVLNLLSNAFKFTFAGTITVRLQECSDHVELSVEDTGTGIAADEIPHLFERFHRIKGAQGRSFEGSGIGLSLVQELVKLHGGSIYITSQLGQGSCFTVSIPMGAAHLPQDRISGDRTLVSTAMGANPYVEEALHWLPEESKSESEWDCEHIELSPSPTYPSTPLPIHPSTHPAKILVVDDNTDMRDYMKRLLIQRYDVEAAEDGVAALDAIRQHRPDLVLTDIMMPRLDGFGLLQALRSDPQTRELPIILLSARAGEEARIEGLEAGADDYLIKPFSTRELLVRVETSLKMARIRREAAIQEKTLRLAAEQAQKETQAVYNRLIQLVEAMSDAFVELDKDWHITYQNAAAERINKGKSRSQVLGKTLAEEWPASVGSEMEAQYRKAMAEQVPVHFESHYYAPPDFDVWLEIHAYPSPERLGIFFRDISDRKRAEAILQQAKEELEVRVAERTAELSQTIAELQQAETTIKASLQEKEILLKEIHHRVKNNLGIVSGLLQMQARRTKDPGENMILQDSQNRIASIALVHEKLYRSADLANIDFSQYLRDLTVYLFDSYNMSSSKITLDTQVEQVCLDIETAIPCGLIVNELVSNALKHAFPDDRTGEIQVRLQSTHTSEVKDYAHDFITLIVRDNGIGLPKDFDLAETATLGLSLVQGLVEQIRGVLEINRDRGTEIKVTFRGGIHGTIKH